MTKKDIDELKKIFAEKAKNETCPHCGACQHCGRGGHQTYPIYPYYPQPYYPWWGVTYCGTSGTGRVDTTGNVQITGGSVGFDASNISYTTGGN